MKNKITLLLVLAFLSSWQSYADVPKPLASEEPTADPLVECAVPINIVVTDITSTSANFSWTPTSGDLTPLFFQYCIVTTQTPEAGPTNPSGTTGSSYFPLIPGTTYYVYVRSFCTNSSGAIWSDWSLPATFTTPTLSVSDLAFDNFSAYPNPADSFVKLSNATLIDAVEIFNALGQNVFSQKYNDLNAEVDMANFSQGYYFMTVHSGESAKTIRLIKK